MAQHKPEERKTLDQVLKLVDQLSSDERNMGTPRYSPLDTSCIFSTEEELAAEVVRERQQIELIRRINIDSP